MKYSLVMLLALLMAGCASDPSHRAEVANKEVAALAPPSRLLSEFSNYELKPIAMSDEVKADEDKVQVAKELGSKLYAGINPLLDTWRANKEKTAGGSVLVVEPIVQKLRVVSGGARYWAGAMMGESFINLDLKLTDSGTGQLIAMPHINQNSGAWAGAWSIGSTDRNLLDYINDIAVRYLEVNYSKQ